MVAARTFSPRNGSTHSRESGLGEVRDRLDKQDGKIDAIANDLSLHVLAVQGLQKEFAAHKEATTGIKTGVETIIGLLGNETEDGVGGWKGTGLLGRVRRNEGEVGRMMRLYRQWIAWGGGFVAAATVIGGVFISVVWYLLTHPFIKLVP